MKRLPLLLAAFATLLSLFAISTPADAHGRFRGGVFLNFGVPWPGYWAPRYYYPPPAYYYYDDYPSYPSTVIVERRSAPEYIEKADVEGRAPAPATTTSTDQANASAPAPSQIKATNWWYWCESSKKYYPYVKECAGGFERVPPQPVPPPANR